MANTFLTPNMSLIIPVVLTDPGPDWASNINSSLTILDSHTHSSGSGIQITPSGININTDLSYNSTNNAIALRSVRFTPQLTNISGASDLGCLYEVTADLWYNDGNGNQIRITQSGSVAGSSGTITGLPSGTASASFSAITGTFTFQQATATGANVDTGSLIIRYPGSYPTPSGNAIVLAAPSSLSGTYQLTLPSLPIQTNVMTLGTTGTISSATYDVVGQGMTSVGANSIANNITRAVGTTAAQGGIAISVSSANFGTTGTTIQDVLDVTITTGGNPVIVMVLPSDPSNFSSITQSSTDGIIFLQNVTSSYNLCKTTIPGGTPFVIYQSIDVPAAGTYQYRFAVQAPSGGVLNVTRMLLIAYELH